MDIIFVLTSHSGACSPPSYVCRAVWVAQDGSMDVILFQHQDHWSEFFHYLASVVSSAGHTPRLRRKHKLQGNEMFKCLMKS